VVAGWALLSRVIQDAPALVGAKAQDRLKDFGQQDHSDSGADAAAQRPCRVAVDHDVNINVRSRDQQQPSPPARLSGELHQSIETQNREYGPLSRLTSFAVHLLGNYGLDSHHQQIDDRNK